KSSEVCTHSACYRRLDRWRPRQSHRCWDCTGCRYSVVSTKNSTITDQTYRIEKQRLLVRTCQVGGQRPHWLQHRRRIMTEAKLTWSIWQALLHAFAWAFTRRGFHRFAEWITA